MGKKPSERGVALPLLAAVGLSVGGNLADYRGAPDAHLDDLPAHIGAPIHGGDVPAAYTSNAGTAVATTTLIGPPLDW